MGVGLSLISVFLNMGLEWLQRDKDGIKNIRDTWDGHRDAFV